MPPSFIILMALIIACLRAVYYRSIIWFICCFVAWQTHAQKLQAGYYNFNMYNGLPSNHVYQVIVDTYGYAWIATTKGVLKYNGYSFKKFGEEEGLAKEDVWQLIEDNQNRVWLGSISPKFGYIQKDKFVTVLENGLNHVYPKYMTRTRKGFACIWRRGKKLDENYEFDLFCQAFGANIRKIYVQKPSYIDIAQAIDSNGALYELRKNAIYKLVTAEGEKVEQKICSTDKPFSLADSVMQRLVPNSRYFILYFGVTSTFYFINVFTGKVERYYNKLMPFESWLTVRSVGDDMHLATNKRVFILDKNLKPKHIYYLKDMMSAADTSEASFVWFLKDRLWNGFSTTENLGMYQHFTQFPFQKLHVEHMNGAMYLGAGAKNSTHFWWNEGTKELVGIATNNQVIRRQYKDLYSVKYLKRFNGINYLCSAWGLYMLDDRNGAITKYISKFKYCVGEVGNKDATKVYPARKSRFWNGYNALDLLYKYLDTLYVCGNRFDMYENYSVGDTFVGTATFRIQSETYTVDTTHAILYNAFEDNLLLDNLLTNKRDSISMAVLKNLGINGIREIEYDHRNGNLFVLAKDKLLLWHANKRILQLLPLRINAIACNMELSNDNLVLNSPHGLVVYKVAANGRVSKPYYIVNYKHVNYKFLSGNRFFVGDSTIVFNTDKGLMSVVIPHETAFAENTTAPKFRLIIKYQDSSFRLHGADTLTVDQRNPLLGLDVINPAGIGHPRFSYNVAGTTDAWVTLNGTEWFVTNLRAGVYSKVYLKVTDEGWNSPAIMVWVYIKPYWWQTTIGKSAIATMLLLLLGGAVFLAIQITRRQVNKVNARRNLEAELKSLRTSMELKSIHAQINPHFIFNTLSTGLYFIKKNRMDDAYDHITAFSELLRNYIKSSRDKYITLQEEIDNLKRYVTLQQSRFENLHEFIVEIGEGVKPKVDKIPALLLQPIVENAINHGLFHKSKPGRLLLRFEKNNNELTCIIDDDGVGRERSKEINAETKHKTQSYGTDLVRELIEAFNKYEPVHITIEYIDKQPPESGTTVLLTIKELKDDK